MATQPLPKSSKRARRLAEAGLQIQERDVQLLVYAYELHAFTEAEAYRLCYAQHVERRTPLSPSIGYRRLGLLVQHRLLSARRAITATGHGAAPLVYHLGPRAASILADRLDLPEEVIGRRIKQDQQLAWRVFAHTHGLAQLYTALVCACRERGYDLVWRSDQSLAASKLVAREGTAKLPLQPDAFCVITRAVEGLRHCYFIELQRASRPWAYRDKVPAYIAYKDSGAYTRDFGYRSLVVLGIATGGAERAQHLKQAAEAAGGRSLFWSASLDLVLADPFGPIWLVAGEPDSERVGLFGRGERGDTGE